MGYAPVYGVWWDLTQAYLYLGIMNYANIFANSGLWDISLGLGIFIS